jgi:hypothetical protein
MIGVGMGLCACFKDEALKTPAYISVQSIQVDLAPGEGAETANITDAWISVDGTQIGAGTFPATFPVILDENFPTNSIRIRAGIKNNGITNTRAIYPFYEASVTTADLQPGETYTINPVVGYDPQAIIDIIEDFETPSQPIFTEDLDGNPNTEVVSESNDVRSGNYSGRLVITDSDLECTVGSSLRIPNLAGISATPVYVEMDYKSNVPVQVGLQAHYSTGQEDAIYKGGFNSSDGAWRKIYFEFTTEVFGSNAPEYSVILRAVKPVGVQDPEILIDNVKLLHY